MEMKDSGIYQSAWRTINDHGIFWESIWTKFLLKSFLSGIARYLAKVKNEGNVAVVMKDKDGKITFGALCEKQENAEANGYTLNFFFNGDGIPEDCKVVTIEDPTVTGTIKIEALERFHMYFRAIDGTDYLNKLITIVINAIKEFFKVNLPINPETELTMEGFYTITGSIVDNKLELNFVPEETLKQIIKDDDTASVMVTDEPYKLDKAA